VVTHLVKLALLAAVPHFGHAFVVVGENTSYSEVTRERAPYIASLRPRGAFLENYRAFRDTDSLANYIGMVSGQYTECEARDGDPDQCARRAPSIFGQLDAARRPWRTWMGSMPAACERTDAGKYVAHHNPALYFTGLRSSCRTSSLPLSRLGAALRSGRVGALNLVVPDNCENGHDPCGGDPVRHFDDFLRGVIPRIEASPAFGRSGVIFVVWDEGSDRQPTHVAALVLGPRVRAGARDTRRVTHYGLERTLADGLGVRPLAHARAAAPILGIWR